MTKLLSNLNPVVWLPACGASGTFTAIGTVERYYTTDFLPWPKQNEAVDIGNTDDALTIELRAWDRASDQDFVKFMDGLK